MFIIMSTLWVSIVASTPIIQEGKPKELKSLFQVETNYFTSQDIVSLLPVLGISAVCSLFGTFLGITVLLRIRKSMIIFFVAIVITVVGIFSTIDPIVLYFIHK